jgi:hypothetical protein
LPVLPDKYTTTIATLDTQPYLTVQEKLVILQNYKDVLRTTKVEYNKALKAKESAVLKEESTKCKFCHKSRVYSMDKCEFCKVFNKVLDGLI